MRAREFLNEVTLNIPDQMVSVQIPLSAITNGSGISNSDKVIVNPGHATGEDGHYKWSPPLQQHLDTAKDAVGPSNNEISAPAAAAAHAGGQNNQGETEPDDQSDAAPAVDPVAELKKKIAAIFSRQPSVLG